MTIYTLDWLQKEAEGIAAAWDGKSTSFEYDGDVFPAEQADTALELLEKLTEVRVLIEELGL